MIKSFAKKIFNKIFNRATLTVLAIFIQFFYLMLILTRIIDNSNWLNYSVRVLALLVALYIVWRDYNPAYKISWIFLLGMMPIMGSILYLLFGNKRPAKSLKRRIDNIEEAHHADLKQTETLPRNSSNNRLMTTVDYIAKMGPYPAWTHTATRYHEIGEKHFAAMVEDLKRAEHFIFMEYFIIERGQLWDEIYPILKEKAAAGLDVRIIYDDIGSIGKVPKSFLKQMKYDNIQVLTFNTMRPFLSLVYNNRDHRKITVIDGYIGYTGGVNVADEYANYVQRFGHWKDTGVRLEGEAVWNLTVMFLVMWNSFRQTEDDYSRFGPHVHHPGPFPSDGIIQPFSDTPLDDENLSENIYMDIVNQAEDYVFIFTPYLIPDNEMITALALAAKRGVDVRLVTPGIPDKKLVYMMTQSHYSTLMKAGVKIYEYKKGFIHAKSFVSDDKIAVVGTINMDYRSLYLHFECGTLMIENSSIMDVRSDAIATFHKCHRVTEEDLRGNLVGTLVAAIFRVFSPVL